VIRLDTTGLLLQSNGTMCQYEYRLSSRAICLNSRFSSICRSQGYGFSRSHFLLEWGENAPLCSPMFRAPTVPHLPTSYPI
jgi:hypothetical protein